MSFLSAALQLLLTPTLGAVSVPGMVFGVQCLVARSPKRPSACAMRPVAAIVVPAHDESEGIAQTVRALKAHLGESDRLIVVADNCTDETATLAREAGAEVFERLDPDRRGKGYALSYAIERLRSSPPSVVVVVDADCELEPGALDVLVSDAARHRRPVQADYLLHAPETTDSALTRVSAFAVLVRNRVRPLGLWRLGLPCQLTGSGMAFPWEQIDAAPNMAGNIVEDMALGLELALQGHAPRFSPHARVRSVLPHTTTGSRTQRRRWETGQLATARRYVPRLLWNSLVRADKNLLALALDLAVPPLALLTLLQMGALGAGVTAVAVWHVWGPLGVSVAGAVFLSGGIVVSFRRFGRDTVSLGDLARVPFYIGRKVGMYLDFFRGSREKEWVRTDRGGAK